MSKKQEFKARVNQLLVEIHRGFLGDFGDEMSDKEVLAAVPAGGLTPKPNPDEETSSLVSKPFTYKWVAKQVKKNPIITSYDMLVAAGFKDQEDD